MTYSAFDYQLPPERIAQRPCHPQHAAKLLVLDRSESDIKESTFSDLCNFLKPNDLLVFNDTRVIPARLFGKRGNLQVEVLLLKDLGNGSWEAIGRPLKKLKQNDIIEFSNNLSAKYISRTKEDGLLLEFLENGKPATKGKILETGLMPIPPYIREGRSDEQDLIDYQTNFAKYEGSIAAPTASLHFSEELIVKIKEKGCELAFLTLHVGLSSIREVEPNKAPGSERCLVSSDLLSQIEKTKAKGRRVVAVGTTVVRALESAALQIINDREIETELFIQPGFEFKLVDAIITNFHVPSSTHLLLVEAFIKNREKLAASYDFAMRNDFRFLSYGDGMFIL